MPPRKQTSRKSKHSRDRSPTPSPSSHEDSDRDWSGGGEEETGPQVANVSRGFSLPPRRSTHRDQGSSRQPRASSGEGSSRQAHTTAPPPAGLIDPSCFMLPRAILAELFVTGTKSLTLWLWSGIRILAQCRAPPLMTGSGPLSSKTFMKLSFCLVPILQCPCNRSIGRLWRPWMILTSMQSLVLVRRWGFAIS